MNTPGSEIAGSLGLGPSAAPAAPCAHALKKRGPGRKPPGFAACQVPGCEADLMDSGGKKFFQRYRICPAHCAAQSVNVFGRLQRFCQQCAQFHLLERFEGPRKSCILALQKHSEKRRRRDAEASTRKRQAEAEAASSRAPATLVPAPVSISTSLAPASLQPAWPSMARLASSSDAAAAGTASAAAGSFAPASLTVEHSGSHSSVSAAGVMPQLQQPLPAPLPAAAPPVSPPRPIRKRQSGVKAAVAADLACAELELDETTLNPAEVEAAEQAAVERLAQVVQAAEQVRQREREREAAAAAKAKRQRERVAAAAAEAKRQSVLQVAAAAVQVKRSGSSTTADSLSMVGTPAAQPVQLQRPQQEAQSALQGAKRRAHEQPAAALRPTKLLAVGSGIVPASALLLPLHPIAWQVARQVTLRAAACGPMPFGPVAPLPAGYVRPIPASRPLPPQRQAQQQQVQQKGQLARPTIRAPAPRLVSTATAAGSGGSPPVSAGSPKAMPPTPALSPAGSRLAKPPSIRGPLPVMQPKPAAVPAAQPKPQPVVLPLPVVAVKSQAACPQVAPTPAPLPSPPSVPDDWPVFGDLDVADMDAAIPAAGDWMDELLLPGLLAGGEADDPFDALLAAQYW